MESFSDYTVSLLVDFVQLLVPVFSLYLVFYFIHSLLFGDR